MCEPRIVRQFSAESPSARPTMASSGHRHQESIVLGPLFSFAPVCHTCLLPSSGVDPISICCDVICSPWLLRLSRCKSPCRPRISTAMCERGIRFALVRGEPPPPPLNDSLSVTRRPYSSHFNCGCDSAARRFLLPNRFPNCGQPALPAIFVTHYPVALFSFKRRPARIPVGVPLPSAIVPSLRRACARVGEGDASPLLCPPPLFVPEGVHRELLLRPCAEHECGAGGVRQHQHVRSTGALSGAVKYCVALDARCQRMACHSGNPLSNHGPFRRDQPMPIDAFRVIAVGGRHQRHGHHWLR